MAEPLAIVFDCGSTNLTVIAVTAGGAVRASASRPSAPTPDPSGPDGWFTFDLDGLMRDLASACREVVERLGAETADLRALTVTTWGADGTVLDAAGNLLHPVISWQCDRTNPLADGFAEEVCDPYEAFALTGYQIFNFNTILKLIWLRRHRPECLDDAASFTMMPGLISHRLTGELTIDATAAGTTMATDLAARTWTERMLSLAGVSPALFPRWVEPGAVIGPLTATAAEAFGLPAGLPVVAAGHDTQFAIAGSGARPGEAVLSSGTWEILATRTAAPPLTREVHEAGIQIELDAVAGLTNPQFLMMGSGTLEWIRDRFYGEVTERSAAYGLMVEEARGLRPGSGEVTLLPSFVRGAGPTKRHATGGGILGLDLHTTRGQVYRAGLEGLAFQLRHAVELLGRFEPAGVRAIRAVGGGSRNELWNQIRADVCGVPVITLRQKEATVLGAAMFAFTGAGVFASVEEAQGVQTVERAYEPSTDRAAYEPLYQRYRALPPALEGHFRG